MAHAAWRRQIASTRSKSAATSTAGPSSSTIRTLSAGGNPGCTAASAAWRASASIISMAAGTIPAAMMSDTAAPAASMLSKAASSVCTASGFLRIRTVTLVTTASVPSEPMTSPSRSGPGVSASAPPNCTIAPSGSTASTAST